MQKNIKLLILGLECMALILIGGYQLFRPLPIPIEEGLSMPLSSSVRLRIPILMYHYVEYVTDMRDTIRQSLNITPDVFEEQVKTLVSDGYTFLTAAELGEILDGTRMLPPKPILLTFDDGHWDVATDILPILKKYNVRATVYVVPGLLGGSDFMSHTQLMDVISSGLFDIGSHTINHTSLAGRSIAEVQQEVVASKSMLEAFGINVVSFAYPNGSLDAQAILAVKQAGYTTAVSTRTGYDVMQDNRFELYRIRPGRLTGDLLLSHLQGNISHK